MGPGVTQPSVGPGGTRSWPDPGPLGQLLALVAAGSVPSPVCVVSGEHGSGRTSILGRLSEETSLPTLWIDGSTYARPGPLESVIDLAHSRALPLTTSAYEEVDTILAGHDSADPRRVARDLWLVAQAHADPGALRLCVVDDFDLLDPASQEVVAYLLRRVSRLHTAAVVAVLDPSVDGALHGLPVVELRPLDVGRTRDLIESLGREPVPYRVAERLWRATGGNPLAILSAAQALDRGQRTGVSLLPHPLPLSATCGQRLIAGLDLDRSELRLLSALAVEELVTVDGAQRLLGGASVDGAVERGLVTRTRGRIEAVRPAIALAAWALGSELDHRSVHRTLAGCREEEDPRLHEALGGEDISPAEVAGVATAAYAAGRHTHAALGLALLGHTLPAGSLALAAQLFADGYIDSVRAIVTASSGQPGCLADEEVAWLQTQVALLSGVVSDPLPGHLPTPPRHGQELREWAMAVIGVARVLCHRGEPDRAARTLDDATEAFAQASEDLQALAAVVRAEIALKKRESWACAGLSEAVRSWLEVKPPGHDINASIVVLMLLSVGDPKTAMAVVDASQPHSHDGGLAQVGSLASLVHVEMALCHYRSAEGLLLRLDRIMPYSRLGTARLWAPQVQVNAVLGRSAERERMEWRLGGENIVRLPRPARGDVASALGLRALVDGEFENATVLLRQALDETGSLYDPRTALVADLLEAARAAGSSTEQARALLATHASWLPDREGERFPGLMARCRALVAEPEDVDEAFATAADLAADGYPADLARTQLAHARCLRGMGRFDEAEPLLGRASLAFQQEGLSGWTSHVEMLRTRPVEGLRALLNPTERRIVRMALERHTNAEIAQSLSMSKRSVELRLTRIFRTLGIARKSQLVDLDLDLD